MRTERVLRDYIFSRWRLYLMAVLFIVTGNIIQSFYPRLLGQFTDRLQAKELTHALIVDYSLLLLAVGVLYGLLGGLGQYVVMRLGRQFEFHTRRRLFAHFTTLSERFYSKNGVGKMLSYVMNDVTAVRESISMGINQTTNATILILSAFAMMLLSGIPFHLIIVCILPLIFIPWIVTRFGPVIRTRSRTVQESISRATESAEEQFGGIRVTKKFAVEPIMINRFGAAVDTIRDNQLKLVRVSSMFQALIPFLGALSLVITIVYGGYLTIHGRITLGDFVALTLYIRMMINPLQAIGNVINTMQRSRASLERIGDLLSLKGDIREADHAKAISFERAAIEVNGLTFRYPDTDRPALEDIHLRVEPGRTLGILGKTGSGKTTLMKLLLRVYDPPKGTILIGGEDILDLKLESLRDQIAYVPQEGFLFSTTIRENIAFYRRDLELGPVEEAARQAQIHESIQEFPEQFETKLGERGITLSGGQRQRTSLARGLIKHSPIIILDDSVSAVDAVTEKSIIEAIRRERRNKTTLLIAHRISALKHADEIIVLDEGRIVQRGTHEQLLKQSGLYADLHAIQEEGSRDEADK
ncbi:ABC transporter ATP-binding protein [Cohnella lubricantis]|uniref:ABC transporter ATP-binding protein n=1 Tax=Cohnella lubricantis TaxID=2163172 RepID=A0A841THZ6_9BACL|nr:ABC transporter ATP-binding protein [Cohnella lubricantis]MBB6678567.1 ABC transporter ATP-binding protein [Cohnella lubricantis]MBP2119124.1 ATP-binding cassette subfamily B protein [Cohnella lubricantis]